MRNTDTDIVWKKQTGTAGMRRWNVEHWCCDWKLETQNPRGNSWFRVVKPEGNGQQLHQLNPIRKKNI